MEDTYGEITHWETHVNSDYNDFLDVAIGEHGPYKESADDYMRAVMLKLASGGIDLQSIMHKNKHLIRKHQRKINEISTQFDLPLIIL